MQRVDKNFETNQRVRKIIHQKYCWVYPSIPLTKTLEVICEKLEADETLPDRIDGKVEDIIKLLEISMQKYFKTLDGNIWVQINSCPIGKSISGEIAQIYVNWFEETFVVIEQNESQYSGKR